MSELKPRITENGIDYILVGDYYIPDLKLPEEHRPIGKYGRMHREYLREVHPARLNTLTLTGELWTYLADLNTQLDDLRSSLEKLQNDYDAKQEELTQLQSDLEDAKADEAQQYEAMKLRIRYMYENSASNYMNLLFESGSISDFLNQAENISQMSKYDRDMLDTYRETKEAIQTKEEQVAQEKEEIVALQQESADKQAAVEELVEATYQQIREYQEDIQSQQTAENDLLTKISSQEDAINDLLRQAKEEEAAARLAAQQAAQAAAEKAAQEAAAKEAAEKATEKTAKEVTEKSAERTAKEAVEKGAKGGSNTGIWNMTEGGGVINGREYSQHAMERMAPDTSTVRAELSRRAEKAAKQKGLEVGTKEYYEYCSKYVEPRNIPPSVIEDAIFSSKAIPGNRPNTFIYETLEIKVVVNSNGKVITVIPK